MHNLSPEEQFRFEGKLDGPNAEKALMALENLKNFDSLLDDSNEALAQLPEEDFLVDAMGALGDVIKRVRGRNKSDLQGVMEMLDDIQQCQVYASQYAWDKLRGYKK